MPACSPAQSRHGGHRTYTCRTCQELSDKRQVIAYFPEHVPERAGEKPG
jgi:hypothetical protein